MSFTTAIAAEGAANGIRANAISPGFVKTPATDATVDDGLRAFVMNMHLIRRAGTPQDIAYSALYLASDESSWVTGQNISVDGGVTVGFRQWSAHKALRKGNRVEHPSSATNSEEERS